MGRAIAYGGADRVAIEQHGDHWLVTLLDFAERAGIGGLTRDDATGELLFLPAAEQPTHEEAWRRVEATWPPLHEEERAEGVADAEQRPT